MLDSDPATARTAVANATAAARQSLLELRRMLAVLRDDHSDDSVTPQPGLADLEQLVGRVRAAGLRVDIASSGSARELGTGRELCVYRVVQESLTNTLKHSGSTHVVIRMAYHNHVFELTVADGGTTRSLAPRRRSPRPGYGVTGMRERAEMFGGVLEAGPGPGGGFMVQLRLPLTPQTTPLPNRVTGCGTPTSRSKPE